MCAGARQRSQIGASRRNTGCHEPPSATSLICAAHRAAGLCSRSACVCPAAGTATYTRTGCIAGVSCHAAAPSSCSNRSNSGFSACFGTCPSLSASADLHTSRSVGSQAGSVTALASASRGTLSAVPCELLAARRRSTDWRIGLNMGGAGQVSAAQTGAFGSSLVPALPCLHVSPVPPPADLAGVAVVMMRSYGARKSATVPWPFPRAGLAVARAMS